MRSDQRGAFSDSKTMRRRQQMHKPEVIDVEKVQAEGSTALTTREQIDTLKAIYEYNKAIPLKRRAKDSLPEIQTFNVAKVQREVKDYKKDKSELVPFYMPIGNNDEGEVTSSFNNDKFSISAKTRAIQRSQSQQKINYIRTSYADLLGLTPKRNPNELPPAPVGKAPGKPIPKATDGFTNIFHKKDHDNPFTRENWRNTISLSVYNRPQHVAERRPGTAKTTEDMVKNLPGWKPQEKKAEVGPDGEPIAPPPAEPEREPILPAFETPFQPVCKDATDSQRQQDLVEIRQRRDYLAKSQPKREEKEKTQVNIPLMRTFERALLLPQEMQTNITEKQYPETGMFLMENPFPKKKKGKKGKKGKKKR